MSQSLRRGVRCLSSNQEAWKQLVFRFDRVGRRGIQIRAAPSAEPGTVNGNNLPVSNGPDAAVSPGLFAHIPPNASEADLFLKMRDSMSSALLTPSSQSPSPRHKSYTRNEEH